MFNGLDLAGVDWQPPVTWDYVKRLKDATSMRLVIKGIVTREDAELAVDQRRRRDRLFESRRARRGDGTIVDREPPGSVAGSSGARSRPRRQRLPARHGHLHRPRPRRHGHLRGAAVCLGPGGIWPGRRRHGPRHPHTGTPAGHALRGNSRDSEDHAGTCRRAEGQSFSPWHGAPVRGRAESDLSAVALAEAEPGQSEMRSRYDFHWLPDGHTGWRISGRHGAARILGIATALDTCVTMAPSKTARPIFR